MDIRFSPHNLHRESPEIFRALDPNLKQLREQKLVYRCPLLDQFINLKPGIYTLSGGRQIGKSTLMKQWMDELLTAGTHPETMVYLTGELIDDHHSLVRVLTELIGEMPDEKPRCIILDEVTYIREWDRGVKYLADAGMLENVVLMLTGSDSVFIQEARMRLPGRRGDSDVVDFNIYPLNFREMLELKKIESDENRSASFIQTLFEEFDNYLIHGGFLTAVNDMARFGTIRLATFSIYSDWIRGDMIKRGKSEHYLREVLGAVIKRHGSQVTWNALAQDLSIDHPKTVADYIALLMSMDVVFSLPALIEDKLTASPKKARKLMFSDPFIFHAIRSWLNPTADPFEHQVRVAVSDAKISSRLAESCAAAHFRRYFPVYYIKAEGEVDIAYIHEKRFYPVEVKWTSQIRPKDLKQVARYPNSRILTRSRQSGEIQKIPTEPLPLALLRIGHEHRALMVPKKSPHGRK